MYLDAWADDVLADTLLAWRLSAAGIESVATVPGGVKVMRRADDGREFVFLLNFDTVATAKLSRTRYTNALTGEPCGLSVEVPAGEVVICRRQQKVSNKKGG